MRVWRLARRKFAALDGAGARLYGGRWNRAGHAMVYTSQNLSLALLEVIVHLEVAPERLPADYVKIAVEAPDTIKLDRIEKLPRTPREIIEAGMRWLEAGATAGLLVPSVIVPEERNLLLNPAHRDFAGVSVRSEPFAFDPRLFTSA